jgi:TRAP-type C4-dicarboxylate transport system substrate-binding protein
MKAIPVRSLVTTAAALLVGLALNVRPVQAADITIKMAGQYPEEHQATKAQYEFKKRVEQASGGRIKVRVFPSNQLGDYTQVYEELRRGTIDMGLISVPSQFDSRLELGYLHYVARNYDEARKVYAPGSYIYKKVSEIHDSLGVKFFGFHVDGFGGLGLTKLPADADIRDVNSKKEILLRVPPIDVFKVTAEDQGFQTVEVPYSDLPIAMQTGTVDGWSGGPPLLNYEQFRDVIKYFLVCNNFFENASWLASAKFFDKLSPKDQDLIRKTANDLALASFDASQQNDEKGLRLLEKAGIKVIRLNDQELAQWAQHARTVTWPKLEKGLSKEIIEGLQTQY